MSSRTKPHVIVIMADQLRYDVLGDKYTPHLNKLAERSTVFERAYCASPLCVPARGAFFTGTYPNVTGCLINPWEPQDAQHGVVRRGVPSMYSLMEREWDSWNVGKQHFLTAEEIHLAQEGSTRWVGGMKEYKRHIRENNMKAPGGSEFKTLVPEIVGGRITRAKAYTNPKVGRYEPGFNYYFDGYFAQQGIEAIRQRDQSKPMLLNMMFLAPHPPFHIPEPWFSRWKEIDLPQNVGEWAADQSPLQLYNLTGAIGTHYTREDWRHIWKVYLGLVSLLDDCVGMIVNELKEQGMYDDSIILFTSDHGEMLGSHRLWQKMCMYEESIRTPLYIKFPMGMSDLQGRRRVFEPISAIDVLPTLCDVLGLESPTNMNGTSLLPLVLNHSNNQENVSNKSPEHEQGQERDSGDFTPIDIHEDGHGGKLHRGPVFIQFDGNGARGNFQRCIRQRQHKLIVDFFKDEIYLELYDIEHDVEEQVNLAFDEGHSDLVLQLLISLSAHMQMTGDILEMPEPTQLFSGFLQDYGSLRK